MATVKIGQEETQTGLNIIFKSRGLSRSVVASRAGIKRSTLREQLAKGFPRHRLRLVIETVTDTPIWNTEQGFIRRKALTARLGFDPWTIPAQQLRRLIPGLQIKGWRGRWKREQLIELLEQKFLTANQNINSTP